MAVRRFSPSRTAACGIAGVVVDHVRGLFRRRLDRRDRHDVGTDGDRSRRVAAATFDLSEVELLPCQAATARPTPPPGRCESSTEAEHLLSGMAAIYTGSGNEPTTPTGDEVDYVTRLLVRQPADPQDFSGRVFVEPFNTSGGADADVLWAQIAPLSWPTAMPGWA